MKNAFVLFLVAVLIFLTFLPSYKKIQNQKKQIAEYQQYIKELEATNRDLVVEKKDLEEDPVYLEAVAREKMGLIREGEIIYKIEPAAPKK